MSGPTKGGNYIVQGNTGDYDTIVAQCEHCGKLLTMADYWKIGGKNLCERHGKAYAEYLKS